MDVPLLTYCVLLLWYHVMEFVLQWRYHPDVVSLKSFLLTPPYLVALTLAVVEHVAEKSYFPAAKRHSIAGPLCFFVGLAMMIVGDAIRKVAIVQNSNGFTHDIALQHKKTHKLMVSGIYQFSRHPGYFGWFLWAVGSQVMLLNPLCFIGYIVVSWRYFYARISFEETLLLQFFRQEYEEYGKRVPTRIPFIYGYFPPGSVARAN